MLAVLLAGQFMALLDVTIVNVAMPTIGRTLHATGTELQLIVSGYTVSYAMLLITGARLGDLRGRRNLFVAGVAVFTLASAVCGFAPNAGVLIAARFVQGAGAAATMPQIMSTIQARFAGPARARALSAYSAVLASGFVAGQVVGGLLVNANLFGSQWRPVFLVNVPIGLAVLALAPRFIPRDEDGPGALGRPWGWWGWGCWRRAARPGWAGHRGAGRVRHRAAADARAPGALAGLAAGLHRGRPGAGGCVRRGGTAGRGARRPPAAGPARAHRARPRLGAGRDAAADGHLRRLPVRAGPATPGWPG